MFRYFLTSVVIAPVLLGVIAANYRGGAHARPLLRIGWAVYSLVWFATLYYLRQRW